jgi:hypothetical protein
VPSLIKIRTSLQEKQMHNGLSEEDSFQGSMTASPLHEESADPEIYAWEHRYPQPAKNYPLARFQERMEWTRQRMRQLLVAVESTPLSQNKFFLVPTLRATHAEVLPKS